MKKTFLISFLIILFGISTFSGITNASNNTKTIEFPPSPKVNQQLFGYFMMDLYHKEIMNYVQSYYKDKNINGYGLPENHEHVSILMTPHLKGLDENVKQRFSYLLKITLHPTNKNGTVVGKDTLYLAVEPSRATATNPPKGLTKIKLIKYEHKEVQKNDRL